MAGLLSFKPKSNILYELPSPTQNWKELSTYLFVLKKALLGFLGMFEINFLSMVVSFNNLLFSGEIMFKNKFRSLSLCKFFITSLSFLYTSIILYRFGLFNIGTFLPFKYCV